MKNSYIILGLCLILGSTVSYAQRDEPPYLSPVPKFTFGTTLAEQEQQLKDNPLLKRFAESRKRLASDPYRPIYHFVSPESRLNDPNGLSYWQGNWHLFYQAYPPEDDRQHWGHAISKDLIHWRDLPYAIYPGPERAVFSGTTLVEDDRVIAMYHGTRVGNMVAVSDDPLLLNWEKVTGNAVIPIESNTGFPLPYRVFDPAIWKKDGIYYSLSAGRSATGPGGKQVRANFLFRSKDLARWEYLHEFVEDDRFTLVGDDGACPYFWPIGNRHIMLFFSHMSGGQYLLGDYDTDRDKFEVTNHGKFNFGAAHPSGVHAPSATPDGKGGVIVIFNVNPGKRTGEWDQVMSLPRRLTLIGEDDIGQEPAGDIESLRYDRQAVGPMTLPANKEVVLKNIKGNAMEIMAEIDVKDAPAFEINVLRSPKKEEYTRIVFYRDRGFNAVRQGTSTEPGLHNSMITLETTHSSLHPDVRPRAPETASVLLDKDEPLRLRIFVDKSIVEVFVNGKQALAARVYPSKNNSVGVSLRSQGKESQLKSLEAWQMRSIY
ncbi:MAG TPA: glycoside hydrolase family 32 protein [Cyclobacteriaceae bacterium]|nr:glycoside hydrolase family 32 protein [Cyclobacteriaceae bacterium]